MTSDPNSIVIVGGGPVGLYLSIYLKTLSPNLSVSVIEKNSWPKDKVCGQGLLPKGVSCLEDIGIKNLGLSLEGIQIHFKEREFLLKAGSKFRGIKRCDLSNELYLKARSMGVTLLESSLVRSVDLHSKKIKISQDQRIREISYHQLIAADGVNSSMRRLLGVLNKSSLKRFGAREHFVVEKDLGRVHVFYHEQIECYLTPVSKDQVEFCFLWHQENANHKEFLKNKESLYQLFEHEFLKLGLGMNSRRSLLDFKVLGPLSRSPVLRKEGVYFVGDACQFKDGITGEGVSLGLSQARSLARHLTGSRSLLSYLFLNLLNIFIYRLGCEFMLFFSYNYSRTNLLGELFFSKISMLYTYLKRQFS